MALAKSVAARILTFALIYGLLALPWPGVSAGYAGWARWAGRFLFSNQESRREIVIKPLVLAKSSNILTRIEIVNRDRMMPNGAGPVRNYDVDQQAIGWTPCAFFVALMAVTPIPWRRRILAILGGVALLQCLVFLILALGIYVESAEVSLVEFTVAGRRFVEGLESAMIASTISFVTPVVIWILLLCIFRFGRRITFGGTTVI